MCNSETYVLISQVDYSTVWSIAYARYRRVFYSRQCCNIYIFGEHYIQLVYSMTDRHFTVPATATDSCRPRRTVQLRYVIDYIRHRRCPAGGTQDKARSIDVNKIVGDDRALQRHGRRSVSIYRRPSVDACLLTGGGSGGQLDRLADGRGSGVDC